MRSWFGCIEGGPSRVTCEGICHCRHAGKHFSQTGKLWAEILLDKTGWFEQMGPSVQLTKHTAQLVNLNVTNPLFIYHVGGDSPPLITAIQAQNKMIESLGFSA